ncbi:MAG: rod shape-determining protein MreD [Pseudomonadota bacterium]|nr:rod shape-determining protein MreD [Pseudomonadota bacterium]
MIMERRQALLLPVSPWFIAVSLIASLLLNMMLGLTQALWLPDLLAVCIFFWGIHQPRRVGIGIAFCLGLWTDVQQSSLMGQHALSYALLSYCAFTMHRRLLWFPIKEQMVQIIPFFLLAEATGWTIRLTTGDDFPGWSLLLSPAMETLMWPVANFILLAPQRRAHNPDANRPI